MAQNQCLIRPIGLPTCARHFVGVAIIAVIHDVIDTDAFISIIVVVRLSQRAVTVAERIGLVFGDREFIGQKWLKFLKMKKIQFCVRVPKHHIIEVTNGQQYLAEDLWKNTNKPTRFKHYIVDGVWGCAVITTDANLLHRFGLHLVPNRVKMPLSTSFHINLTKPGVSKFSAFNVSVSKLVTDGAS